MGLRQSRGQECREEREPRSGKGLHRENGGCKKSKESVVARIPDAQLVEARNDWDLC